MTTDGDLWVRVTMTSAPNTTYDVFGVNGRFKGSVAINGKLSSWVAPVVRGEQVWAIVRDELDVLYIMRGTLADARNTTRQN